MTTTLRAKTPEDLLAAVPITLGFEPEDSIVMLTFGAQTPFHARIDLPPRGDPDALEGVVAALLAPCRRHRCRRVVFVLYGAPAAHCRQVARALRRAFSRAGIEVIESLRAHAGRWYAADRSRPGVPAHGVPYDTRSHPFRAEAVMAGHVTLGSRTDLVASLAPDPAGQSAVQAVLGSARPLAAEEVATLCERHATAGTAPSDLEAAALSLAVQHGPIRDAAWVPLTRECAARHVALWSDLLRRAPDPLVPSVAAVLAFAAWLHGDGALAWCAIDRCFATAPDHSLGTLVAHLLEAALPPTSWETMRAHLGDLLDEAG